MPTPILISNLVHNTKHIVSLFLTIYFIHIRPSSCTIIISDEDSQHLKYNIESKHILSFYTVLYNFIYIDSWWLMVGRIRNNKEINIILK